MIYWKSKWGNILSANYAKYTNIHYQFIYAYKSLNVKEKQLIGWIKGGVKSSSV